MNTGTSVNETGPDQEILAAQENGITLSSIEKDTLGEISNICMGTSATTLSMMLGKRVVITTPQVTICRDGDYLEEFEKPVVATQVSYTRGLDGNNVFLLKKEDALLITSLLMGGEQTAEELGDMYLSAMSEVMNQMVGSSSTALADILQVNINISPPATTEFSCEDQTIETIFTDQLLVRINFRMEIEDLLVSNIMQIMPIAFAKKLAISLLNGQQSMDETIPANEAGLSKGGFDNGMDVSAMKKNTPDAKDKKPVELRTAKFQSFGENGSDLLEKPAQQNIDLIIDIPLQVTVVLGKSRKSIKEVLDMGLGSVIVLDRLAGEMVDVLVNGKAFARGEVVVIDDNYGVRITEMIPGQIKM